MSKETLQWLQTNTLIGMTSNRGNAWHHRAVEEGEESNHYEGAIPVGDVQRRLFHWDPIKIPVYTKLASDVETMTGIDDDGNPIRLTEIPGLVAVGRSDTGHIFKVFGEGYEPHPYREWLLDTVSSILGDTLVISSAGLLREGGQAWVEVSVPETLHDEKTGFEFRPNLLAATSLDGSLSTTYARTVTATVCHAKDTFVVDGEWRGLVQDHPTSIGPIRSEGREVAVWGLPFTEKVSGEHRYWTRERRRTLSPAAQRELGVTTARIGEDRDAQWVFANSLSPVKHEIGTPIDQTVGEVPAVVNDAESAWIVGYWWGNGHLDTKRGYVTVSIPDTKPEVLARIKAYAPHGFAIQKQGCVQFSWRHRELAELLDTWERPGHAQKVPPIWAEQAPYDWQLELARGYFEADGNTGNTDPGLIIMSVSLDGLLSLRTILARLGIASSIRKGSDPALRNVIQGRKVHAQEQFSIRFISDRFGYPTKHAHTLHPYIEDGYLWSRVQHVSPWEGEVYPITCDDHQYVTPFGLSHNCDNTMAAALLEGRGQRVKIRHSRYSGLRLDEARESLSIIEQVADSFTEALHELTSVTVTDRQWYQFLDQWQKDRRKGKPEPEQGRGKAIADRERDEITSMYRNDNRANTWNGTAFGVVQAVNTWAQHVATVKGASRADRNAEKAITGGFDTLDAGVLASLDKVLENA